MNEEESIRRSINPRWSSYKHLFSHYFLWTAAVLTVTVGATLSSYLYNRYEKIKSLEYLDVTIKKESIAKIGQRQIQDFNYVYKQVFSDKKALENGYLKNFLRLRPSVRSVRFFDENGKSIFRYSQAGEDEYRHEYKSDLTADIFVDFSEITKGALVYANGKSGQLSGQLQVVFAQDDLFNVLESIYVPNVGETLLATVYGEVIYPTWSSDPQTKKEFVELFLNTSGQDFWRDGILTYEIAPPFDEFALQDQQTAVLELSDGPVHVHFTPLFLMSYIDRKGVVDNLKPILISGLAIYLFLLIVVAFGTWLYAKLRRRNEVADMHILHQKEAAVEKSRLASLGEMAASIAHEINNPLSIIMFKAEILEASLTAPAPEKEKQKELIDSILNTVDRASKIVKGLKSLGRDGSQDPLISVPLKEVVEDALSIVEMKAKKSQVELRLHSVPPYFIQCRPGQITQVLINLISNSLHAISTNRRAWISLDFNEEPDWYFITVTDSGRGIPLDVQKRIFEPFFTTKGLNQGTGLGLSLSRRIIEDHGGDLYLDNECKNTRFVIKLPRRKGESGGDSKKTQQVRIAG